MLRVPRRISAILLGFSLVLGGCAATPPPANDPPGNGAGGMTTGTGGAGNTGGSPATGGNGSAAGGAGGGGASTGGSGGSSPGTGGSPPGTGGTPSTGSGGGGGSAPPSDGGQGGSATPGSDAGGGDAAGGFDAPPIMACPGASIDRLQKWLGHANLIGSGGDASILVQEGGAYVAKARFNGNDWSEVVVLLANAAGAGVDLSKSVGFTIRYSATADLWIQMRGTVQLHGGDQHGTKLPATGGMTVSRFVSFAPSEWARIPGLDPPTPAFANVLKTASMFNMVGMTANTVVFSGLRFDNYVPACR
jgi:hypothetical protein